MLAHLRAENVASEIAPRQLVREVSYASDEGGNVCHFEPQKLRKSGHRLDVLAETT